jgi:hypothetical protein
MNLNTIIFALVGKAKNCTGTESSTKNWINPGIYFFNVKEQETYLVHFLRRWVWWQETSDVSLHYKIVLKKILG